MQPQPIRPHRLVVLTKMFEVIGLDFEKEGHIIFDEPNWYNKYRWTAEQQREWYLFFFDYLWNNVDARNEFKVKKKIKQIKNCIRWFDIICGWKDTWENNRVKDPFGV